VLPGRRTAWLPFRPAPIIELRHPHQSCCVGQTVEELRGYVVALVGVGDDKCDLGLCLIRVSVVTPDGNELTINLDHESDPIHAVD
jgi:hypothetical protein